LAVSRSVAIDICLELPTACALVLLGALLPRRWAAVSALGFSLSHLMFVHGMAFRGLPYFNAPDSFDELLWIAGLNVVFAALLMSFGGLGERALRMIGRNTRVEVDHGN
jgi:hypothetical protein